VLERIHVLPPPAVIFVTGNESFAVRAFDVRAIDYLLKPCSRERMRVALRRAREFVRSRAGLPESEARVVFQRAH
jgi:DNA-binding LytR/AlgR family response regulator